LGLTFIVEATIQAGADPNILRTILTGGAILYIWHRWEKEEPKGENKN